MPVNIVLANVNSASSCVVQWFKHARLLWHVVRSDVRQLVSCAVVWIEAWQRRSRSALSVQEHDANFVRQRPSYRAPDTRLIALE